MTQSPQPGEILTSESVKLLKAGDVLWAAVHGVPVTVREAVGVSVAYVHPDYAPGGCVIVGAGLAWLSFIGRPDPEGWMPHDGGPNPVPGCVVEVRYRDGAETDPFPGDGEFWDHTGGDADIIAFRLAAPSVERDLGSLPASPSVPTCDAADIAARLHPELFSSDEATAHRAASPMHVSYARRMAVTDVQRVLNAARATTAAEPGTVGMERGNAVRNEPKSAEPDVAAARERLDRRISIAEDDWNTTATVALEDLCLILSAYDRQGEKIERLRGEIAQLSLSLVGRLGPSTGPNPLPVEGCYCKDTCGAPSIMGRQMPCLRNPAYPLAARARQGGENETL